MPYRILFLFWCLLVILLREYRLLVEPRFWAEEGTIFYAFAFNNSVFDLFSKPHIGYYALYNNLSALLSVTLVPVEYAPFVTTYLGIFIVLLPVLIILFTNSLFWDTTAKKIIISLFIIFLSPHELWLNSTNAHFYLGLSALLVLTADETREKWKKMASWSVLILAGLSGPETCFFIPALALNLWRKPSGENIIRFSILAICALVQSGILIWSALYHNQYGRYQNFDFNRYFLFYIRDSFGLLLPIGQNDRKNVGFAVALFSLYLFYRNLRYKNVQYLIISFFIFGFCSTFGSISMRGGDRYSYITTIILLMILTRESLEYFSFRKFIPGASLFILIISFTLAILFYQQRVGSQLSEDNPVWKTEVAKWKKDKTYTLKVPPHNKPDRWEVVLSGN
ncbi:MAG: hypothetical protein HYY40_00020 [Bacteroidetes bacterium]|nr:hypothetical protein [Bacteroidota bacterium]